MQAQAPLYVQQKQIPLNPPFTKGEAKLEPFPLPASRFPLPASRFPLPASRLPAFDAMHN